MKSTERAKHTFTSDLVRLFFLLFAATNETTLSGKAPFFLLALLPSLWFLLSLLTGTILSRPSFEVPSEVKVKYKAKDATVCVCMRTALAKVLTLEHRTEWPS